MRVFTAEEKVIIQNIASLLEQLNQIAAGESAAGELIPSKEETVQMDGEKKKETGTDVAPIPVKGDDEEMIKSLTKALKSLIAKADEGTTASDDAEDRLDDIPDVDAENISEVAKAILAIARKSKSNPKVAKSTNSQLAKIEKAIVDLTTVMKAVVEDQQEIGLALTNTLDGLGVLDEVRKSMNHSKVSKADVPRSVRSSVKPALERALIRKKLINEINGTNGVQKSVVNGEEVAIDENGDPVTPTRNSVRKELGTALTHLFRS